MAIREESLSTAEEHPLEEPTVVVRVPFPRDLPAIVSIDGAWSGRERKGYLEARLNRAMRPSGISLARVAETDGKVVGFLFGEVTRGEFGRTEPVAWIDTFGVRRDQVRRGVGSSLLVDFMNHARALDVDCVRTLLDPKDEELTDFLERHDFRVAPTKIVEKSLNTAGGARSR